MAYRVDFSGMVCFVPEVVDGTAVKQVRLLFLDGRPPHRATDDEELTGHFAFIRFKLSDLADDSPRRADLVGNNGYGVCFLNNEELVFTGAAADTPQLEATLTRLDKDAYAGDLPPLTDLTWILPLDKALGKEGERILHGDLLAADYTRNKERPLIGRTRLAAGTLVTRDLRRTTIAGRRLNADCSFGIRDRDDPSKIGHIVHCSQPIATRVAWEPKLGSEQALEIASSRLAGSGAVPTLKFQPPSNGRDEIEILVWNATFAELLDQLRGAEDHHQWFVPSGNRSFRSFYRAVKLEDGDTLPVFSRNDRVPARVQSYVDDTKNPGCPCCRIPVTKEVRDAQADRSSG